MNDTWVIVLAGGDGTTADGATSEHRSTWHGHWSVCRAGPRSPLRVY